MPKADKWKFIPKNIYNRIKKKRGTPRCSKCNKTLARDELVLHRFTTNRAKHYCAKCGPWLRL